MVRHRIDKETKTRIERVIKTYKEKTGVISLSINSAADTRGKIPEEWLCHKYYSRNKLLCIKDHRFVLNESFRMGNQYVHLCHKDLIIWGVPVTKKNQLVGGVLSGFLFFEQHLPNLDKYRGRF